MVGHGRDQSALTSPHQLGLRELRGTRCNVPPRRSPTPKAGRSGDEVAVYPASLSSSLRHFRIVCSGGSRGGSRTNRRHKSFSRVAQRRPNSFRSHLAVSRPARGSGILPCPGRIVGYSESGGGRRPCLRVGAFFLTVPYQSISVAFCWVSAAQACRNT